MSAGSQRASRSLVWALTAVALVAVIAGLWAGARWVGQRDGGPAPLPPQLEAGAVLPQPKPLAPFVLTDQDGRAMTETSLRGKWTFAAVGYTTCPDVCPMTMATFVALQRRIGAPEHGQAPQFLLISVDPQRDTPERIAQYVHHFHPEFLGATGPDRALQAVVRDLGGLYVRVDDPRSALGYTVDHSAAIYLIDPDGRLAAIFSTPHDPTMMARDFAALARSRAR